MIDFFRRSAGSWAAKILLGLLVASFLVYGVGEYSSGFGASNTVAVVDGDDLTTQEFIDGYRYRARISGLDPASPQAGLRGPLFLSDMIRRRAVAAEAAMLGIGASDELVVQQLRNLPFFHDQNGVFSREIYNDTLRSWRLSRRFYDEELRRDATVGIVAGAIDGGAEAPDVLARLRWRRLHEERDLSYVNLTLESVDAPKDPDDAVLKLHYDADPSKFALPERRKVKILALLPEDRLELDKVTDADVKARYDRDIAKYVQPERRNVELLVFDNETSATEAKARLTEGASVAQILSDFRGKVQRQELGYVVQSAVPFYSELAKEVFAEGAPAEGVFGPQKSGSGAAALAVVAGVFEAKTTPIEAVSDELKRTVALERARVGLPKIVEDINQLIAASVPAEKIASDQGFKIIEASFDANGLNKEGAPATYQPNDPQLPQKAFAARSGRLTFLETAPDGARYALEVTAIRQARTAPFQTSDPDFAELRRLVLASWRLAERQRVFNERVGALQKRLEAGEELAKVAGEYGLEVKTAAGATRAEGVPGVQSPALAEEAFKTASKDAIGTVVSAEAGGVTGRIVAKITAVRPAKAEAFEAVSERSGREMGSDIVSLYLGSVFRRHVEEENIPGAMSALRASGVEIPEGFFQQGGAQ